MYTYNCGLLTTQGNGQKKIKHIIFFSSGIASFKAADRVTSLFGAEFCELVFADTLIEDEDNYRFLKESSEYLGSRLVWLKDNRTPWEVFKDVRFIGNSRVAHCSTILKFKKCREYIENNYTPEDCILYLGIDWEEANRVDRIVRNWQPYKVDFPLMWEPWLQRSDYFNFCSDIGIKPPRLYRLGFSHANCGGFCVKAGKKQFKRLLEVFPDRYKHHENKEAELQAYLQTNHTILTEYQNSVKRSVSLKELRDTIESQPKQKDLFADEAEGGCNCFTDD